jgi:hypothetical protein
VTQPYRHTAQQLHRARARETPGAPGDRRLATRDTRRSWRGGQDAHRGGYRARATRYLR